MRLTQPIRCCEWWVLWFQSKDVNVTSLWAFTFNNKRGRLNRKSRRRERWCHSNCMMSMKHHIKELLGVLHCLTGQVQHLVHISCCYTNFTYCSFMSVASSFPKMSVFSSSLRKLVLLGEQQIEWGADDSAWNRVRVVMLFRFQHVAGLNVRWSSSKAV